MLLSLAGFSQNDFESRYYTIDVESLPDIPQAPSLLMELDKIKNTKESQFTLGASPSYSETRNNTTINSTNYWQPVDMTEALVSSTVPYNNSQFKTQQLQNKQFGFSISGNGGETTFDFGDGETKVQNSVYSNQRSFSNNPGRRGINNSQSFPRRRQSTINW